MLELRELRSEDVDEFLNQVVPVFLNLGAEPDTRPLRARASGAGWVYPPEAHESMASTGYFPSGQAAAAPAVRAAPLDGAHN